MKKIVCAHLFNDQSGSPLVLSTVIKGFLKRGLEVDVLTSMSTDGFLSNLEVNYVNNGYKYLNNKYLRLMMFLFCQVNLFFKTLKYRNVDAVIYVNTLLPFGVALAGKLIGKKVIYHIHETSVKPVSLKRFLKWVAQITADEVIYVSGFLQKKEEIKGVKGSVIYNALSKDFIEIANLYQNENSIQTRFVVLMLCSLKDYKGVNEFVILAKTLPQLTFELVLNAEHKEIEEFFKETRLSENLIVFPKQSNVHGFYQRADLVVNLSHPKKWVETFGMTLLEGMQYGIPSIAPTVGGPTEIVKDGYNGYQVDQREISTLVQRIKSMSTDNELYRQLSTNARKMAQEFSEEEMCGEVMTLVN